MKAKNVFKGENGLSDYLNPDNIVTPIVELPNILNPFYVDGVRIFAKLLNSLSLTNSKSIPAYSMLKNSDLSGINTIIENSSGNTVLSLSIIAKLFGIHHTKAFVSNEITPGKLKLLRLFGVNPIINKEPICPDPKDKTSGIYKAMQLGNQDGRFNPGQYNNEHNPNAHYQVTGPQIYDQLEGNIQIFVSGLGTTGTMIGTTKYLKEQNGEIFSLGVIRKPNNPIPGPRTQSLLSQIAFDWKSYVDQTIAIATKESYLRSLEMIRNGILVGPSSGFALSGLQKFLEQNKYSLDNYRNKDGEINIVFVCCDSPYPYIDEYFTYLNEKHFPEVENKELLLEENNYKKKQNSEINLNYQLSPIKIFKEVLYGDTQDIDYLLEQGKSISINKDWILYDIRTKEEFEHFHIPGSQNIEERNLASTIKKVKAKKILIICRYGLRSLDLLSQLTQGGLEIYSLNGGVTEWSNNLLPRWKPKHCLKNINN